MMFLIFSLLVRPLLFYCLCFWESFIFTESQLYRVLSLSRQSYGFYSRSCFSLLYSSYVSFCFFSFCSAALFLYSWSLFNLNPLISNQWSGISKRWYFFSSGSEGGSPSFPSKTLIFLLICNSGLLLPNNSTNSSIALSASSSYLLFRSTNSLYSSLCNFAFQFFFLSKASLNLSDIIFLTSSFLCWCSKDNSCSGCSISISRGLMSRDGSPYSISLFRSAILFLQAVLRGTSPSFMKQESCLEQSQATQQWEVQRCLLKVWVRYFLMEGFFRVISLENMSQEWLPPRFNLLMFGQSTFPRIIGITWVVLAPKLTMSRVSLLYLSRSPPNSQKYPNSPSTPRNSSSTLQHSKNSSICCCLIYCGFPRVQVITIGFLIVSSWHSRLLKI